MEARGLDPIALYVLDDAERVIAQPRGRAELSRLRRVFITGDTTATVVDEVNTRDIENGSADLVDVDLVTGAVTRRRELPRAFHRERAWMSGHTWDPGRRGFWRAPAFLQDVLDVGIPLPPHLAAMLAPSR